MTAETAPVLGQWPNAPLVFVLAQVRFHPLASASPESIREILTKRVGKEFSTIVQASAIDIQIKLDAETTIQRSPQTAIGYDMLNGAMDASIRVVNGAITFSTTTYKDSVGFMARWTEIVGALEEAEVTLVTRLGLRYVDFILPRDGKRPEDYVHAPWNLLGMPALPGAEETPSMNVSMMDVPYPKGRMRLQFMRGFGVPNLPADLHGLLPPANRMKTTAPVLCGIIDTDRWIDGNHPADIATLQTSFVGMHKDLSGAFRAMTTDAAHKEWQAPPVEQETGK